MSQSESVTLDYTLAVNTDLSRSQIMKLETSLMRILSFMQRLTPNNSSLSKLISTAQHAITVLRSLQIAMQAVQVARMAAGDPIAWIGAGTTFLTAGMAGYSMYESMLGAS